ncbi:MAG: adenosine deaminase [Actinobacteria bacterium]|nr:adenosine deaminase [Actinomycetota bacterium]
MPDVFDAIPKVELHCHIEGTIRPSTVSDLARKNGRALPVDDVEELYDYDSLNGFLEIFWFVQEMLADRDDWRRIAYESVLDGAPHGLRYRETFFTPARHIEMGQDLADIVAGLTEGLEAAEAETGARAMLICDMDRAFGAPAGVELIERLAELRRSGAADRVIGVGMDSTEIGVDPLAFAPAYELAKRVGLRRTAHAGEDTGPETIAMSLDALGIERVDHGLSTLEDPELTKRVVGDRIPLTVCPNSNVVIANKVPTLSEHPFRRMREAGLLATLNTDDPAMIDLDLGQEYRSVAEALAMSFDDMAQVALDGIEAAWLDATQERALRADFEDAFARLRPA